MRSTHFVMAAAVAAFSGTATAQTTTAQTTTAQTTTTQTTSAQTTAASSSTQVATPTYSGSVTSHWIAAGFAGGTWGATSDEFDFDNNLSFDLGGQVGYLWRGMFGGEFIADFTPSVNVDTLLLANDPDVNTWMFNAIGAYPLGTEGQIQPYVSGGIGGIRMGIDLNDSDSGSQRTFGWNLGGGLLWYGGTGHFGVRTDLRFYRASEASIEDILSNDTPASTVAETLLSGLGFWRANAGLAFRW